MFQPALVLLAFAIEIYLKGLLALEEKAAHGHNHADIFKKLDPSVQKQISIAYSKRYDGADLTVDIINYSKMFVEGRYAYESDEGRAYDISGAGQLASALYEVWCSLRPDLVRAGLVHDRIIAPAQGIPIIVDAEN